MSEFFTHSLWRVREGEQEAFVAAWQELSNAFADLPERPLWGTLIQSLTDPAQFYSFGPWRREGDINAMRQNVNAREALDRVRSYCVEATPGAYRRVLHIEIEPG